MSDRTENSSTKFLSSKWGELAVLAVFSALAVLFTVIVYSVKFTELDYMSIGRDSLSFWSAKTLYTDFVSYNRIKNFNVYFIVAFIVELVLFGVAATMYVLKKDKKLFYAAAAYNILLGTACMITGIAFEILRAGAIVCAIIDIVLSMAMIAFMVWRRPLRVASASGGGMTENVDNTYNAPPLSQEKRRIYKIALLIGECVAIVAMLLIFFIPTYTEKSITSKSYILIKSVFSYDTPIYMSIMFVVALIAFFADMIYFASSLSYYNRHEKLFVKQSKTFMLSSAVITLVFFVFGYCVSFYLNLTNTDDYAQAHAYTVAFIPFLLSVVTLIAHAVICGRLDVDNGATDGAARRKPLKIEPLIYAVAATAVMFLSLILNIVKIQVTAGENYEHTVSLNGYQLLSDYNDLEAGFQMVAFIEFAFLLTSAIMLAAAVAFFFAKEKGYYKAVKTCAIANFLFVLVISLFGMYFNIAQKINIENVKSLLDYYGVELPILYDYKVKSQTIFMLIASAAVIVFMLFRGVFGLAAGAAESGDDRSASGNVKPANQSGNAPTEVKLSNDKHTVVDFDACPAFTELDMKQDRFKAIIEARRERFFENPTLSDIVRFVVDYARESRLHLSYSVEDIATFVAGMGASRLAILQGMSGTGKTSLPKIFAEAILGECEIIEVESSWRDKNELLGYYNEFSKCFTPKKFTQCLYKARLNMPVLTFIVLDEMNLSRIEYYFSDFLSLMENEEDKREIKLLNIKLGRTENGVEAQYKGLTDGHTLKVPPNVWFVGTANRDESTFEISDKVYDRAQTMNFNKRAPKITSYGAPLEQRFIPYGMLIQLMNDAKNSYKFDAEKNALVQNTERLLAKYNISFGNRILKQMEDFVKIYCACFGGNAAVENDAVERILLSKVVSKLENKVVENKESLAAEFDKLGLKNCGTFIRKLNED